MKKTKKKYYGNGGAVSPDDNAYNTFVKTLPSNLRGTDTSTYNLRGYWESLGKPSQFDYSQPKESDGYYHAFSRNPQTGEILKKENHPTFRMAIEGDMQAGYSPYRDKTTGKIYTFNEKPDISKFEPYNTASLYDNLYLAQGGTIDNFIDPITAQGLSTPRIAFGPGGEIGPDGTVYVTDPNDPRLKNYQAKKALSDWSKTYDNYNPGNKITPEKGAAIQAEIDSLNAKYNILPDVEHNLQIEEPTTTLEGDRYVKRSETGVMLPKYDEPTKKFKYAPPEIVEKQKKLKDAGLYDGTLDGIWGKNSQTAWEEYNKEEKEEKEEEKVVDQVIKEPVIQPAIQPTQPVTQAQAQTQPQATGSGTPNSIKRVVGAPGPTEYFYIDFQGRPHGIKDYMLQTDQYKNLQYNEVPYKRAYGGTVKDTDMQNMDFNRYVALMNAQRQQMDKGGTVLSKVGAASVGAIKGGVSAFTPPAISNVVNMGIDSLHGALDKDISEEERSLMGYGQAAAGIVSAVATGGATLGNSIGSISSGLGEGIAHGSELSGEGKVRLKMGADAAGMLGGLGYNSIKKPTGTEGMNASMSEGPGAGLGETPGVVQETSTNLGNTGQNIITSPQQAGTTDLSNMGNIQNTFNTGNQLDFTRQYGGLIQMAQGGFKPHPMYKDGQMVMANDYETHLSLKEQGYGHEQMKNGGMIKRADGSYSPRGMWDNIRANAGSGNEPTAEMLAQERKIKSMASGGFTAIENGGTHEQNPMGGVPIGPGASVEEGETVMDLVEGGKFVFSDRFGPKGKKGKTFADISKKVKKKYKDREGDAAAKRAMNQELYALANQQEEQKETKMAMLQAKMDELNPQGAAPQGPMQTPMTDPMMPQADMGAGTMDPSIMQQPQSMMPQKNGGMLYKNGGKISYNIGGITPAQGYTLPPVSQVRLKQVIDHAYKTDPGMFSKYGLDDRFGAEYSAAYDKYKDFDAIKGTAANTTGVFAPTTKVSDPNAANTSYARELRQAAADDAARKQALLDAENERQKEADIRKRNAQIYFGSFANSAPDLYNLYQGIRGPEDINLAKFNPDFISLEEQRNIARVNAANSQATQRENVRNTAQSSGAALAGMTAGTAAIDQNLGNILRQSAVDEETTNTQIANQAKQYNIGVDNKETELGLMADAKAQEAIASGLAGLGRNAAGALKDTRMSNQVDKLNDIQLEAINNILSNYEYDKTGKIRFKTTG